MTPRKLLPMPAARQVRYAPDDLPMWRRLLQIREPVVYELAEPYTYRTVIDGHDVALCLPMGFRSDLASTPRLTWLLGFRPDGLLSLAAWYHDWYYRHNFFLGPGHNRLFEGRGKRFADRALAQIAAETGGIGTPGRIAQAALAAFGWWAWRANQKYRDRVAKDWGAVELHGDYHDE